MITMHTGYAVFNVEPIKTYPKRVALNYCIAKCPPHISSNTPTSTKGAN